MGNLVDNPYWNEVKDLVKESEFPWSGGLEVGAPKYGPDERMDWANFVDRYQFVPRYAWTITDPQSVAFVAKYGKRMFDPMAGTGYWAYVLRQLGVDIICYDNDPHDNPWHGGQGQFTGVMQMDCAESAARHLDRVMLLAWPPYNVDVGTRAVKAYQGKRIIYIGESDGGCTGDEDMHKMLDNEWRTVACHRPVQWWGVHDYITVYDRA